MAKKISKRLSLLTEEERETQLYAERCYNIGWDFKNNNNNEAAIWYFEEHLNNMIIPSAPLGLIVLYPDTRESIPELYALRKYVRLADDYNYKLYLQALKEHPELAEQLYEALETNTNLVIDNKQILKQHDILSYIGMADRLIKESLE